MDLNLWLILLILLFTAIQIARAVSILGKIKRSNEIIIKCLDAHESLIKKNNEEVEQQGVAIESIKDMMLNK